MPSFIVVIEDKAYGTFEKESTAIQFLKLAQFFNEVQGKVIQLTFVHKGVSHD